MKRAPPVSWRSRRLERGAVKRGDAALKAP